LLEKKHQLCFLLISLTRFASIILSRLWWMWHDQLHSSSEIWQTWIFNPSLLLTYNASSHLTSHYNSSPISLLHNLCSQYIIGLWISETSVWDSRIESNEYQECWSQNFCTSMFVYCRYLGTCRMLYKFQRVWVIISPKFKYNLWWTVQGFLPSDEPV
jgi:hypothetical protein